MAPAEGRLAGGAARFGGNGGKLCSSGGGNENCLRREGQPRSGGAEVAELHPGARPAGGTTLPLPPAASPPFSWQGGQLGRLTVQENTGFASHQQRKTSFFSAHGQKGRRLRGANTWLLPYHRAWGHFMAPRGLRAGSATSASPSACPPGRCTEVQPSGSGLNPGWGCCTRSALFCELTICFPNGLWEPTVSVIKLHCETEWSSLVPLHWIAF